MSEAVLSTRHTVVFTGALGSGKTEVAINYSRAALAQGRRVVLADCDVVTPYFRVGDHRDALAAEGLRVIAAPGDLASFELPAVPPEFSGALADPVAHVVLDVGGDSAGARFLAGYAETITAPGYDMWLVVNPFRPAASDPQAVAAHAGEIAEQCGLRFTGVIANPHLGPTTELPDLVRGLAAVRASLVLLDLPLIFVSVEARLRTAAASLGAPVLALRLTVRLPWEGQEAPPAERT
jgi:hypothetical protein